MACRKAMWSRATITKPPCNNYLWSPVLPMRYLETREVHFLILPSRNNLSSPTIGNLVKLVNLTTHQAKTSLRRQEAKRVQSWGYKPKQNFHMGASGFWLAWFQQTARVDVEYAVLLAIPYHEPKQQKSFQASCKSSIVSSGRDPR